MPSILIVDDEPNIRSSLRGALGREGYAVEEAESVAAARAQLREAFDFVLLDVWFPNGSGLDLLAEIRESAPDPVVIMMSGHATIDTAVEATRFGALDFLEKPIALQRLLAAVKAGLERGRLARNLRAAGAVPPVAASAAAPVVPLRMPERIVEAAPALPEAGSLLAKVSLDLPLREARDQFERAYFSYHLVREHHSMTRVADRAGLERTHLYRKLKQLGIDLGRGNRRTERAADDADPEPVAGLL